MYMCAWVCTHICKGNNADMHALVMWSHALTNSLTQPPLPLITRSYTHSLTHSIDHSLTQSITHLLTHSLPLPPSLTHSSTQMLNKHLIDLQCSLWNMVLKLSVFQVYGQGCAHGHDADCMGKHWGQASEVGEMLQLRDVFSTSCHVHL